jgi:hypothetical protein
MASHEKPAILPSVALAWSDTMRALTRMPATAAIAVLCVLAHVVLAGLITRWIGAADGSALALLTSVLLGVAWSFVVAPVYIAVHRFILLGETSGYWFAPGTQRFRRFFGYMVALDLFMLLPSVVSLTGSNSPSDIGFGLGVSIGVLLTCVRVTLLFPAVAVDAPGANLANAFADTAGNLWRIFAIGLLLSVPPFIISVLLFGSLGAASLPARIFNGLAGALVMLLLIAMASRLYQRLGDRLHDAGPSVGPATLSRR